MASGNYPQKAYRSDPVLSATRRSGSGDKEPVILVQGYFDNFTD